MTIGGSDRVGEGRAAWSSRRGRGAGDLGCRRDTRRGRAAGGGRCTINLAIAAQLGIHHRRWVPPHHWRAGIPSLSRYRRDAVHRGSIGKDAYWPSAPSDFAKAPFDGVGGPDPFALSEGLIAPASKEIIEVVTQASDCLGIVRFPAVGKASGGRTGLRHGLGIDDGLQIGFDRRRRRAPWPGRCGSCAPSSAAPVRLGKRSAALPADPSRHRRRSSRGPHRSGRGGSGRRESVPIRRRFRFAPGGSR